MYVLEGTKQYIEEHSRRAGVATLALYQTDDGRLVRSYKPFDYNGIDIRVFAALRLTCAI